MTPWGAFRVLRPGLVPFDEAWDLQRSLAAEVRAGAPPVLVLLEHPAVFTLGKHADASNLLNPGDIPVRRIDRGGDVTWHGPGQLIAYPILSLRERKLGVRTFVEALEGAIVDLAAELGVDAAPKPGCVGVWTKQGKLASIGIRVANGVTMHGAALNVNPDFGDFARINPCGVKGGVVTSLSAEAGRAIALDDAIERFVPRFQARFRFDAARAELRA